MIQLMMFRFCFYCHNHYGFVNSTLSMVCECVCVCVCFEQLETFNLKIRLFIPMSSVGQKITHPHHRYSGFSVQIALILDPLFSIFATFANAALNSSACREPVQYWLKWSTSNLDGT